MKITIGIVNFNRLHYLKSSVNSLMLSIEDFKNIELICVDDGSIESGTKEYLNSIEKLGWKIIHQDERRKKNKIEGVDNRCHISPFSEALNIIYKESSGDIIIPLQGDGQFIRKNWLEEIIRLVKHKNDIACIVFDAQRKKRLEKTKFKKIKIKNHDFYYQIGGENAPGAGECVYLRKVLDAVKGWTIKDGINAESNFSKKVKQKFPDAKRYSLNLPASIAIYNEEGTNSRIRGNRRFGTYFKGEDDLYYKFINKEKLIKPPRYRPYSIEEIAQANGNWKLPLSNDGNWIKNPLQINENTPFEIIK